jgi:hypothetical protein
MLHFGRLPDEEAILMSRRARRHLSRPGEHESELEDLPLRLLVASMDHAARWIRGHVMRASTKGESDVNTLYSDIITRIISVPSVGRLPKGASRDVLTERVTRIEQRNGLFARFGLTPPFGAGKLLNAIQQAAGGKLRVLRGVLEPYLDSVEAKLKALASIQDRVATLVDTINGFLLHKRVDFHVERGFAIVSSSGEELAPRVLSSGERHLLLLFCNSVTSLGGQSIFIIDEPEISLNIKWQRTLISSLLQCSSGSPVQHIFATHSMEILSQHMDKVVRLVNRGAPDARP